MYEKIIGREHPKSKKHPPMPRENRAAQFAPFAALTGFDDDIEEEARLTDKLHELTDETAARLDEFMQILSENIKSRPEIEIVYFKRDEKKEGGEYIRTSGKAKRLDESESLLIFEDGMKIPFADIRGAEFVFCGGLPKKQFNK